MLRHLGLWEQQPDPQEGKTRTPVDEPVVLHNFAYGYPDNKSPPSSITKTGRWRTPHAATAGGDYHRRGLIPFFKSFANKKTCAKLDVRR